MFLMKGENLGSNMSPLSSKIADLHAMLFPITVWSGSEPLTQEIIAVIATSVMDYLSVSCPADEYAPRNAVEVATLIQSFIHLNAIKPSTDPSLESVASGDNTIAALITAIQAHTVINPKQKNIGYAVMTEISKMLVAIPNCALLSSNQSKEKLKELVDIWSKAPIAPGDPIVRDQKEIEKSVPPQNISIEASLTAITNACFPPFSVDTTESKRDDNNWWGRKILGMYRPRRVQTMYRSLIITHPNHCEVQNSLVYDAFFNFYMSMDTPEGLVGAIQPLRSFLLSGIPLHPTMFFWSAINTYLSINHQGPTSLTHRSGTSRQSFDLLQLYSEIYGTSFPHSESLISSIISAVNIMINSLFTMTIGTLFEINGKFPSISQENHQCDVSTSIEAIPPSGLAIRTVKLVESIINDAILFPSDKRSHNVFRLISCPRILFNIFIELHAKIDEVYMAIRASGSHIYDKFIPLSPTESSTSTEEKSQPPHSSFRLSCEILAGAIKGSTSQSSTTLTNHHIINVLDTISSISLKTEEYANKAHTSVVMERLAQNTTAHNSDPSVPPLLPLGPKFFTMVFPVKCPTWDDFFSDSHHLKNRDLNHHHQGKLTATLFVKYSPVLFVTELIHRRQYQSAAAFVLDAMKGHIYQNRPINLFLFPARSPTQLTATISTLQAIHRSNSDTLTHSYVTSMVSNMHLLMTISPQILATPSTFVYNLQSQLVNIIERDISKPLINGICKKLLMRKQCTDTSDEKSANATAHYSADEVRNVLDNSYSNLQEMIPLMTVSQSYLMSFTSSFLVRFISFLTVVIRVEGIWNKIDWRSHYDINMFSWRWARISCYLYKTTIFPAIRCSCGTAPNVVLYNALEDLLFALSNPSLDISDIGEGHKIRRDIADNVDAILSVLKSGDIQNSSECKENERIFIAPSFVDVDLLTTPALSSLPQNTNKFDGTSTYPVHPSHRFPHDLVQLKEHSTSFAQALRRVTIDNVHQYNLSLRKVLFAEPVMFIQKLVSQAVGNDDVEVIFCQAQLLQGAPKAILRMLVVLTMDTMLEEAIRDRPKTEQRVSLASALIAFVWAQNSKNFEECGTLIMSTIEKILRREAKCSATFSINFLKSLLLHMLHVTLESEEQYNSEQLVALSCFPTAKWYALGSASSFLKGKWFDPLTMLVKMKKTNARTDETKANANNAAAFGFTSSILSERMNIPTRHTPTSSFSTNESFSYLKFIFSASFTPLTLHQCRLRFIKALDSPLYPNEGTRKGTVGCAILAHLKKWQAKVYDIYSDMSGTVEQVLMTSARHYTECSDITLAIESLMCWGRNQNDNEGSLTELPPDTTDCLPHLERRCKLLRQELLSKKSNNQLEISSNPPKTPVNAKEPIEKTLNDIIWNIKATDVYYAPEAYHQSLRQIHLFVQQVVTGKIDTQKSNEQSGAVMSASAASVSSFATLEDERLMAYIDGQEEDERQRLRQHNEKAVSRVDDGDSTPKKTDARSNKKQLETNGEDHADGVKKTSNAMSSCDKIMRASWLRLEQKVILKLLLEQKDLILEEAKEHEAQHTKGNTGKFSKKIVDAIFGEKLSANDRDAVILHICHDSLVPRALLSTQDAVAIGLLLEALWIEYMKKSKKDARNQVNATESTIQSIRKFYHEEFLTLLYTFIASGLVFLPYLTDSEARRLGVAIQRVMGLATHISSSRGSNGARVLKGQVFTLSPYIKQISPYVPTGDNQKVAVVPCCLETMLCRLFCEILIGCETVGNESNIQGSGYTLMTRNTLLLLERLRFASTPSRTLFSVNSRRLASSVQEPLFPSRKSTAESLIAALQKHAVPTSPCYAAASSLTKSYGDFRNTLLGQVKTSGAGTKRDRTGD